jgi:hypothetical protein
VDIANELLKASNEVMKIDEQIKEMEALATFKGELGITITAFGTNGSWKGDDDIVCSAINKTVQFEIDELQSKKAVLLVKLCSDITNDVRNSSATPTRGALD